MDRSVARLNVPQNIVGESPRWDADRGRLLYVDIFSKALHSYDPVTQAHEQWDMGELIGFWVPTVDGRYLVGGQSGIFYFDSDTQMKTPFVGLEADDPGTRCNDARCDSTGRLWVSTMAVDGEPRPPVGSLYSVDPDGSVQAHLTDICIGNSLVFTPDETALYFSDTPKGVVWRYRYDVATGSISEGAACFTPTEAALPDGGCLDADGAIWIALANGKRLERRSLDGALLETVALPCQHPTMCGFGGPTLSEMYVTSFARHLDAEGRRAQPHEGAVYTLDVGRQGVPEAQFGA